MAWGDLAATMAVMAPSAFAIPVLLGGTEEQKAAWLPPVIEAEWKPYTAAFTEPRYDFYPAEMETRAEQSGDGYTLKGEKSFVPYADQAEAMLVFADLDGETQAFFVPSGAEGLSIGEREKLLGIQAFPTFPVTFEDVQVPMENRLGGEEGASLEPILASARAATAAMAIGLSKAALDYALPYAKEREVWGRPIAQRQSIAFMLAEMLIEIEANRLLVWEAAWKLDEGEEVDRSAYLAITGASDTAMIVTDRAVQTLGGHGYIREHPVELWMRNGRGILSFVGSAMV
jgi:alkylation response protein AidB-like acyl-CoA dehydrogenase